MANHTHLVVYTVICPLLRLLVIVTNHLPDEGLSPNVANKCIIADETMCRSWSAASANQHWHMEMFVSKLIGSGVLSRLSCRTRPDNPFLLTSEVRGTSEQSFQRSALQQSKNMVASGSLWLPNQYFKERCIFK